VECNVKRLNGMDAILLYSEAPNVHTHTLKIAIVDNSDGRFTVDAFREILRQRLQRLEPLRYKLVDIPGRLHHPMWLENCPVDLDYHVRCVQVPGRGEARDLDQIIGEIASTPLSRDHPLWVFYYVAGLSGGRIALVGKIHHALADGMASANLLARAMDMVDAPSDNSLAAEPCTWPSSRELLWAAGRDHTQQIVRLPSVLAQAAAGAWRLRRRDRQRGYQPDLARLLQAPPTFLNHVVSPVRTFARTSIPLSDVKDTAKKLEVTINDLVLSMAAGALRDLALRYDGHADRPIVASVPTSADRSADRITGNEIGGMAVSLPVHIDDVLERVRLTSMAARFGKEDQELFGPGLYGDLMDYVPPAIATNALHWLARHDTERRLMNVPISNVPGPREFGYFNGARVTEIYSVGPLAPGCGINITVWSYVDALNVSVIADDQTVDDPHEATDAMVAAFAAIRGAVDR
jgi:diacylglycerol O-acyltransferase / wax synthase